MLALLILLASISITIYIQTRRKDPEKIFNVYSQPGKWYYLKFVVFYCLIWIRRMKEKLKTPTSPEKLEMMKALSQDAKVSIYIIVTYFLF